MPIRATAWFLETVGKPLVQRDLLIDTPSQGEVVVEVGACGVCHTDLGFADGSVAPRHALPLVLGHEIMGTVVDAAPDASHWRGRRVLIPAVIPCGSCAWCAAGRGNACPQQKMPGNDIHGGFATHVTVPAGALVPLDDVPSSIDARSLSVVADAASTAWQGIRKAELAQGDVAFVVGTGGVGGFLVQMAKAVGAYVVACDVDERRLQAAAAQGADLVINVKDRNPRDVRKAAHGQARTWDVPSLRWRIFECSGVPAGQQLAFTLLAQTATMVVIGFTPTPVELRLSNVMALDATIHGTWGCAPARYAEVMPLVLGGKVKLADAVTYAPLSDVNRVLDDMANHRLDRRVVLDPRL
ncbi:MAG: 6-hydroxycyclohex-1-ene-1-carbonyl-CoA dehydrogenase [Myxococcota bacterium]